MGEPAVPTVAVTRSVEANRSLATRLESAGLRVVVVPLTEVIGPTDGGAALTDAAHRLGDYRWVVLTSANGVEALAATLADRSWPNGLEVAAVGPTTAAAAREAGMPVALVPAEATAAALVEAFPMADEGGSNRVLAPLAELAGPTVEDGLTASGWQVDRVEAYRTITPDGAPDRDAAWTGDDRAGTLDAVTFFSPSAVERWAARFGPNPPLAVCIGPSTGDRARVRGFDAVVAEPHSEDGVLAAVVRVLADRGR